MKYSALLATIAPVVASSQWWNGAPECAQSCLSSAWAGPSGTTTSWWPQQSEYCDSDKGSSIGNCISDACSSTATAFTSYSSLSSSLCSRYASCTSAGSTGVQTITYSGGPVTWAQPGGWGGGRLFSAGGGGHGPGGDGDNNNQQWGGPNGTDYSQYWSAWASAYSGSKTWSGGVVTVTGCAFDGSPWFVGPNCGWNGLGGFNGFVGWGSGWSWGPTQTQTVTVTTTDANGQQTTETGLGTVAIAVSGTLTTSSLVGVLAEATGSSSSGGDSSSKHNAAPRVAPGAEGSVVTVFMGVGLGAVLAVAGML